MVREVEAEQTGSFADVMSLHQQTLRLVDDVVMEIADGCAARGLVNDVAEVTGANRPVRRRSRCSGSPFWLP